MFRQPAQVKIALGNLAGGDQSLEWRRRLRTAILNGQLTINMCDLPAYLTGFNVLNKTSSSESSVVLAKTTNGNMGVSLKMSYDGSYGNTQNSLDIEQGFYRYFFEFIQQQYFSPNVVTYFASFSCDFANVMDVIGATAALQPLTTEDTQILSMASLADHITSKYCKEADLEFASVVLGVFIKTRIENFLANKAALMSDVMLGDDPVGDDNEDDDDNIDDEATVMDVDAMLLDELANPKPTPYMTVSELKGLLTDSNLRMTFLYWLNSNYRWLQENYPDDDEREGVLDEAKKVDFRKLSTTIDEVKVNFLAIERTQGRTLKKMKNATEDEWRSMLFQILYTFEVFNRLGLRHNDAHQENIFVDDMGTDTYAIYSLDAESSFIVNVRNFVKVFDLDLSSTVCRQHQLHPAYDGLVKQLTDNDLCTNRKLSNGNFCADYGICNDVNRAYDSYLTLGMIYKFQEALPESVRQFIQRCIPSTQLLEKGDTLGYPYHLGSPMNSNKPVSYTPRPTEVVPTYQMLMDDFFAPLRMKTSQLAPECRLVPSYHLPLTRDQPENYWDTAISAVCYGNPVKANDNVKVNPNVNFGAHRRHRMAKKKTSVTPIQKRQPAAPQLPPVFDIIRKKLRRN